MKDLKHIPVTQPSLAPLKVYTQLLEEVWSSGVLTHNGPMVRRFESEVLERFNLPNMVACSSGTIALQMAIKALGISGGEIITTPFTWIATVSAIKWERCHPVFADIDSKTLNIDVETIEPLINENTVAIMPVHVFGNPCNVEEINELAAKYNLKVIYDAAHALGSYYRGKSVLEYGDVSATSFHATKLLNSGEGGGCTAGSEEVTESLKRIRYFGHDESRDIVEDGFNGKMTEIHAALGLANLTIIDEVLAARKNGYLAYKALLSESKKIHLQLVDEEECNFSYFPIILPNENCLHTVQKELESEGYFSRRYFYPSVNVFRKILENQSCPKSEDISRRVLCLPLFYNLDRADISRIATIVRKSVG